MTSVTLYSTTWCGYCRRLKFQLEDAGINYREIDVDHDPDATAFVIAVNRGNRTVPVVEFADGSTATNPSLTQVQERLRVLAA